MSGARSTSARRPRARSAARAASPRASYEELEIRTRDGVALRAVVDDPPDAVPLRGTCVLAHALLARRTEFGRRERPGLAHALAARGFRTIAFDFRGHGDSAPAPDWGYDDLVRHDLPAVVECARARAEGKPVLVVGHSLGGHVALAAQGARHLDADGILAIAANVWHPAFDPSLLRRAAKSMLTRAARPLLRRLRGVPARALRVGTDDASARAVADLFRFTTERAWRSADGQDDYLAGLARVTAPVCAVVSDGDRILCHPDAGAALARRCAGPVEIVRVRRGDDGGPPPGHMALVTSDRARSSLLRGVDWLVAAVG